MLNSQQLHDVSQPTLDAYDGSWLEMLENPAGSPEPSEVTSASEGPLDVSSITERSHFD
jgi:hypothetical protein